MLDKDAVSVNFLLGTKVEHFFYGGPAVFSLVCPTTSTDSYNPILPDDNPISTDRESFSYYYVP